MIVRSSLLPAAALLLGLPFALAPAAPRTHEDALRMATENAASAEGKMYTADVERHFAEQHENSLRECSSTSGASGDLTPFQLVLRVGKKGKVEEVLLQPATRVGACMARTAVKDHLRKPPKPGYWVAITIQPLAPTATSSK